MSKKHILIAFFLWIVSALSVMATDYPLRHYTVADGLPSNEVYHVFQDSKGYIWFGTDNGAAQFNGNNFKVLNKNSGLLSNNVFEVYEDASSRIWFLSFSDKFCFMDIDSIHNYKYNSLFSDDNEGNKIIEKNSFYVDSVSTISFISRGRRFITVKDNGEYESISGDSASQNLCWKFIDPVGRPPYALKSYYKGYEYVISSHLYDTTFILPQSKLARSTNIKLFGDEYILFIDQNIYHFGAQGLIDSLKMNSQILYISDIFNDLFWVGCESGAYQCSIENDGLKVIDTLLNKLPITSITSDYEKGIWFSTRGNGVYYLDPPNTRTEPVYPQISRQGSHFTIDNDDKLYISTESPHYYIVENNTITQKTIVTESSNSLIKILHEPISNQIYFATLRNTLYYKDGRYLPFSDGEQTYSQAIIRDKQDSSLWLGHTRGILQIKNNAIVYSSLYDDGIAPRVTSFCYYKDDPDFYVGTNELFCQYDRKKRKLIELSETFGEISVTNLCTDDSLIFIGTKSKGLLFYDGKKIHANRLLNGFLGSRIHKILIYKDLLWISSSNGIYTINPYSRDQYFEVTKIPIMENSDAAGDVRDMIFYHDTLLLSTNVGIYAYPHCKQPTHAKVPIYITNININLHDKIIHNNHVLKYSENNINFEFHALTYQSSVKAGYQYMLKGLDNAWQNTRSTDITYHNLPSGEYKFMVRYYSEFNPTEYSEASITFRIKKPWWRRWWFYLLAIGTPVALIFYLQSRRLKRIHQENDFRHELLDARQKALMNQINPHFIFNSLNSIQLYILENDSKMSGLYLSKFANLIRMSLEISQHNKVSLHKEIEVNSLYMDMEKLRFRNRFSYEVENNLKTNPARLQIPPFLVQPLLENAIWHGLMSKEGNGKIKIIINQSDDYITIQITDNGIGRKAARELTSRNNRSHKPVGISVSRRRLLLLSQQFNKVFSLRYKDLYDAEGNACGTTVILTIPYDEINYQPKSYN